jgi:glycosyltransferase involved in cell wall biosynthesis
MNNLPISVVIATKNADKTLEACLISIKKNNPSEIIVVDGNSTDKTVEIAKRFTKLIYSDGGREFNYAQQLGAEQATEEFIAFVDSDIVLPAGSLTTLLGELKDSTCLSMQAKLLAVRFSNYWERATDWNVRLLQERQPGGLSAALLRRETIMKYRLDSSVNFGSDSALKYMVEKDGYRLGVSSSVFAYHHHRANFQAIVKQRFRYGQETVGFIRGYGPLHPRFWPPLVTLYWLTLCLTRGKPDFIPYFVINGAAQTAGLIKGFAKLSERNKRKNPST